MIATVSPLCLRPLSMGIACTLTLRPVGPGTHELLQEETVRGTLARYTTQPRIVTDAGAWNLTVRRARLGWYVVATRDRAPVADAAYYPDWISGGTIAFAISAIDFARPCSHAAGGCVMTTV